MWAFFGRSRRLLSWCPVYNQNPNSNQEQQLHVLKAYHREWRRKGGKGKLGGAIERAQGRIPGVLFERGYGQPGSSPDILISLEQEPLLHCLQSMGPLRFLSSFFILEVYATPELPTLMAYQERVLPRKWSFNKDGLLFHVGFMKAPIGSQLNLSFPIVLRGQQYSRGIKNGGVLRLYHRYLTYDCQSGNVPLHIEVDVSGLDIGDNILLKDINTHMKLVQDVDPFSPLCEIVSPSNLEHCPLESKLSPSSIPNGRYFKYEG